MHAIDRICGPLRCQPSRLLGSGVIVSATSESGTSGTTGPEPISPLKHHYRLLFVKPSPCQATTVDTDKSYELGSFKLVLMRLGMPFKSHAYFVIAIAAIALLTIAGLPLYGQISSGTIVGTIVDQTGQSVLRVMQGALRFRF